MPAPNYVNRLRQIQWSYSSTSTAPGYVPVNNAPIGPVNTSDESLTTQSVVTANYKSLLRRPSLLPNNPYEKRYGFWVDQPFTMIQTSVTDGSPYKFTFVYKNTVLNCLNIPVFDYYYRDLVDDPTQKVIAAIQNQVTLGKTQALVTLAEANKTAAMVAKTATRLYRSISALKRLDLVGFASALDITVTRKHVTKWHRGLRRHGINQKWEWRRNAQGQRYRYNHPLKDSRENIDQFAASTWLEYTYGWKPLLSDIYSSAEALASLGIEMSGAVRTAKSRFKNSKSDTWPYTVNQFSAKTNVTQTWSVEIEVEYSIANGGPSFSNVFGLQNPATVVWELVPFSFVVDWFIPIGQSLAALTAYNDLNFHRGYKTTLRTYSGTTIGGTATFRSGSEVYQSVAVPGVFSGANFFMKRERLEDFPRYGFPTFKNPMSVSHMTSAVALLQSLFRKKSTFS